MQVDTNEAPLARPRSPLGNLYVQVLVAIVVGGLIGHYFPEVGPLGTDFIKLVKMVIAPVIFLTVVTGIAGMRDLKALGSTAAKAFGSSLARASSRSQPLCPWFRRSRSPE